MTIKNTLRVVLLAFGLATMSLGFARSDVKDGNAIVKPAKNDKFTIDGSTMGKAELYGYMGDLRDRETFTGIVLKRGSTEEQRQVIASIAKALGLKAYAEEGRELKSIDLPADAPKPAPPPIEDPEAEPAADSE